MFYIELLTSGLLLSRLGIVGASSTLLSLLHQFIYMAWTLKKMHGIETTDAPEREPWTPMHFIR